MTKVTFKVKIVAEADDTRNGGHLSMTYVLKLLEQGKMEVEVPEFFDEPTILLTER